MTRFELFRKNLWLALRRAPRDERARLWLLPFVGILGYFVYLALVIYKLGPGELVVMLVLLIPAAGLVFWIRRGHRQSEETMLKISVHPPVQQDDLRGHRVKLVREVLRAAVLVDRAGCEAMHKHGKLAAEHTGIHRQRTLDLVRSLQLWAQEDSELQLLYQQEGGWETSEISRRMAQVEDVRVLRWVVGIDPMLVPFEHLRPGLQPALEITQAPELVNGERCLPVFDLRPAEHTAELMLHRCIADGAVRGWLEWKNREQWPELLEATESFADESSDLLIGAERVGSAASEKVQEVAQAALRRMTVLLEVIRYLNGPSSGDLSLRWDDRSRAVESR